MTGGDPQLDAGYGESWDPERRALVGPLPDADARRRHAAGDSYAVLLGGAGRPRVLLEVEGQQDSVTAWCFDELRRRTFLFEFRLLGSDRMALLRMAEWRYAAADRPEFDASSPRCITTFGKGGAPVAEAIGAPEAAFRVLDGYHRWIDVPPFGTWAPLAAFLLDMPPERERHRIVRPARHERPEPSGAAPAWEAPNEPPSGALRAGPELVTAFSPPARYTLEPDDGDAPEVVVETRPAGLLRMPTGLLVSADPGWLSEDLKAFTVALPRGHHPVTLAIARFVDQPDHVRVAGCRVGVREAPVVSWEQALRPGEDPSTLGDDQFFGTGVDSGLLCFFDAAALPGLAELGHVWDEPGGLWDELTDTFGRDGSAELEDPETDTNLIAFRSGWGDGAYPVWIGRAADGDVVCVVADTQVLSGATLLPPTGDRQNAPGGPS